MSLNKNMTYFSAAVCWEYIEGLIEKRFSTGERPIINGRFVNPTSMGQIMRWEKHDGGVSITTLDRILTELNLQLANFEQWAQERDLDYIIQEGL